MTPQHEEALRALRIAERDLIAYRALRAAPDVSAISTCFFAQQAVEKMLKAVLFARGVAVPPVHDLVRLSNLLTSHADLPVDIESLRLLNPFAVAMRYDDLGPVDIDLRSIDDVLAILYQWSSAQCDSGD